MIVNFVYDIHFELCSLMILACLTLQFLLSKRFPTVSRNLFLVILAACILDLGFDILGSLAINNIDQVPIWTTYLVNELFYCIHSMLPLLLLLYIFYAVGMDVKRNPKIVLLGIPDAIFLLVQFINPFTGIIFSVQEVDGRLAFVSGSFSIMFYIVTAFYMLLALAVVIRYRQKLSPKQFWAILIFNVVTFLAMFYQIVHPDMLMTGTAITIAIMLWDLTLQNPEDMMDEETGAYDSSGLKLFLSRVLAGSHIHAAVVEIDGLSATERGEWNVANNVLLRQIGSFFSHLSTDRMWIFRDSKTRFWIIAKDAVELDAISKKIVERFKGAWDVDGISMDLMARVIYFSTMTSLMISKEELLSIVDEAMETETMITQKRKRLVIDSSLLAKYRRRHILEESIRRSLNTKEGLYACFQPIIPQNGSEDNVAEVLLRYNDPNLGAVSPSEFIPLIEKCGLSIFIDNYVIELACHFLASHPEVNMLHVNLSASEFFNNPDRRIMRLVDEAGIDPARICFEITESYAARSSEMLKTFMETLIDKGFSFAMDDYGTGYSNALQVTRMPFRTIKIDKALLSEDDKANDFLRSSISMFHDMGFQTVVEGVETKEQFERVKAMGTDYIQGFLFSPPLVDTDYLKFIKDNEKLS